MATGLLGEVLVVDDEPVVRHVLARCLSRAGHGVREAGSAAEALEWLRSGARVDLLITDATMPGMSGDELSRLVRESWPTVPILVVTGRFGDETRGAPDLVLQKPLRSEVLLGAVAHLLATARVAARPGGGDGHPDRDGAEAGAAGGPARGPWNRAIEPNRW